MSDRQQWGSSDCHRLYNAIRKYGPNGFTVKPLQAARDQASLDLHEIVCIKKYGSINEANGYNIAVGGLGTGKGKDNPNFGKPSPKRGTHLSEETKQRISRSRTGIKHTEEAKQKIIIGLRNREVKDSTRKKLSLSKLGDSNPMFGAHHSDEHKDQVRKLMQDKVWVFDLTSKAHKRVSKQELDQYLDQGWTKGRWNKKALTQ